MPSSDTQWKPGQSGNPAGRPKGARSKFSEDFLRAFAQDFERHGESVIEDLRKNQPATYFNGAVRLMPKLMELSGPDGESIPLSGTVKFKKVRDE